MKTIVVANQKGGVGKTITAVTLAAGAARLGIETLLIDLDPQGNIADSLGLESGNELAAWLGSGKHAPISALAVSSSRAGLDILRSDKSTATLEIQLAGQGFAEYSIQDGLEHCPYGLVVLDCKPSHSVMQTAALVAADWLIIPTKMDQFAVKGIADILGTMGRLAKRGGKCQLGGIIPTFYEHNNESCGQLENIASTFAQAVFTPVPKDIAIRRANRLGQTIWEYAPSSRAAKAYESILSRVLGLL